MLSKISSNSISTKGFDQAKIGNKKLTFFILMLLFRKVGNPVNGSLRLSRLFLLPYSTDNSRELL